MLGADGSVLASTGDDAAARALARATLELVAAAFELALGAVGGDARRGRARGRRVFVAREGGRTIAATTGPEPTAGLVVYDLRTCLGSIETPKPKKRRARKPKEPDA